ncbi:MAG: hypothetical protein IKT19_04475 [Paludibacteraceae bacterium]|nr:hypothetical protein [Paludibacteraceae bacterium]
MKKIFTLIAAVMMVMPLLAIGDNSGKTKLDAKDFTWDKPMTQDAGTSWVWYVVDLSPLYEQDNPALKLYLTNVNSDGDATVQLEATVAGQSESRTYTIGAKQSKEWSANASTLVRMKQKEIYLTLKTNRRIQLSAKVFEASDLNDLCKEATPLDWTNGFERGVGDVQWFKVDLTNAKKTSETRDVQVAVTNKGTKTMKLYAGQSLDCPSSGVTMRVWEIPAGETKYDTVPNSMIKAVAGDELYVSIENTQRVAVKATFITPPPTPVMDVTDPWVELHVTDTLRHLAAGKYYYRIKVADMDSLTKYEPEFTFRNEGAGTVKMTRKMSFALPAYSTQGDQLTLAAGEETIEVIKKNTIEGLTNEYIYVTIQSDAEFSIFGRFKHVREGKACKTNIDFDWEKGHEQMARTTQWYAIDVREAKRDVRDIRVTVENRGETATTLKAAVAFSCPYIDLQEFSATVGVGSPAHKTLGYATYAMMTDTIWVGLETSQPIYLRADTLTAELPVKDDACLTAEMFDWTDGGQQKADTAIWYKIDMRKVRNQQSYPTVVITNLSETASAVIEGRLSLECPDSLPDQVRTLTIPAGGVYEKQLSRNMFENIKNDSVYIRVASNQAIKFEVRRQAVPAGTDCASAIRFNWVSGNDQKANANLWYVVDLAQAVREKKDVEVTIKNKDTKNACEGAAWISFSCPDEATPQTQNYKLAAGATKSYTFVNSSFSELASDSIYIRLIGSTELHISGKLVNPQPFDTIRCADMTPLNEFVWDSLYTQTVDTAWYEISYAELQKFAGTDLAPEVYIKNLTRGNNKVIVEAAFSCPIEQTMMGKQETLSPGQSLTKQLARTTIEQYLNKNQVYLRVIAQGMIEFRASKEDPNKGNTCMTARPIHLVDTISQAANTVMWYRINTADLKQDNTLNGKSLSVHVDGSRTNNTTIKVGVYEDCAGEDMLDGRGKRTIGAGKSSTRNIPAYVVYGLADKDLYIRIETDQAINFATSLSDYAPLTPVKDIKSIAKTAAPNVTYTLKANEENWFAVCLPQMRNNYVLTDSAKLYIENPNAFEVKVTGTATWQDTLTFQIPERTRSISANRKVFKPFKECIDRAIKRAGFNYSIEDTETSYIDSLIRAFVTEDSLTMYVMIKPEAELKWGIMMDKANGDICDEAIIFDWEHGNVHPAGDTLWYRVQLDSVKLPADKDLRIHIANWGDTIVGTEITASLTFDCRDAFIKTKTDTVFVKDSIDADRDLLVSVGWPDLYIQYASDQPTWMWVELIDTMPRQIDRDTVRATICNGETYTDTITGIDHEIIDETAIWSDTVSYQSGVQMRDSITVFIIRPIMAPDSLDEDSINNLGMAPVLQVARPRQVGASSKQLTAWMKAAAAAVDTINQIDTVYWARPIFDDQGDLKPGKAGEGVLDTVSLLPNKAIDTLLLVVKGFCADSVIQRYPIEFMVQPSPCTNDTVWDKGDKLTPEFICDSVLWTRNGQTYKQTGVYDYHVTKPQPFCGDTVYMINIIVEKSSPVAKDTVVLCEDSYTWNGKVYTQSGDYDSLFVNVAGCDSLAKLHLVLNPSYFYEETHSACNEYTWRGTRYVKSGVYYDSLQTIAGCDSVYKLTLTLNYDQHVELPAVAKYGNLIVLIDKHKIDSILDWEYAEEDVVWYKVGLITPIAYGYYYATGKPLSGSYYAVIEKEDETGCARVATTVIVNCDVETNGPKLVPTLAQPAEQMQLQGLDPNQTTTVRVFSTEGRLLNQYVVTNESTFLMPAQKESGFYMVEVLTDEIKLTLRYIVK